MRRKIVKKKIDFQTSKITCKKVQAAILLVLVLFVNISALKSQMNENYIFSSGMLYQDNPDCKFTEEFTKCSDEMVQFFVPQKEKLEEIQIRFAINNPQDDDGSLKLKIQLCDSNEELLYEEEIGADSFEDWHEYVFSVRTKVNVGERYQLKFTQSGIKQGKNKVYMKCFIAPESARENICYTFNGKKEEGNIELTYVYNYSNLTPFVYFLIFEGVLILLLLILKNSYNKYGEKINKKISVVLWIVNVPAVFFLVQLIATESASVRKEYVLLNLLIYYVFFSWLAILFKKVKISIIIMDTCMLILALAEYFVMKFRGQAITLFDIVNIKTATTVAGSYNYDISLQVCIYILCFLFFIVLQLLFQKGEISENRKRRTVRYLLWSGYSLILVIVGINLKNIGIFSELNLWDISSDYNEKGYIYTLLAEGHYIKVKRPKSYSIKNVEEIVDNLTTDKEEEKTLIVPENIIVIMNESFANLEVINEIATEDSILQYIKSLDNVSKGYLYVPVFGGGTAETEYEVLTGNSKQFLPVGSSAYGFYTHDPEYGLTYTLRQQGYYSIALHPFDGTNWNRNVAYQKMQFDKFFCLENWEDKISCLRWCADDKSAYDKIIQQVEAKNKGERLFEFCVTMQNHGSYDEDSSGDFVSTVDLNYDKEYPLAETYFSVINVSDQELKRLLEYFKNLNETTMVVMFGDHQPAIEDEFYDELFGKKEENLTIEELEKKYMTPYIIWCNYPCETTEENMSSNYFGSYILQKAGLKMSLYEKSLLTIKEILPVINRGNVQDKNGQWYAIDENLPDDYKKILEQYENMQYNNIFDHKKNVVQELK